MRSRGSAAGAAGAAFAVALVLAVPASATRGHSAAAPADTVVVAQGVDPTTMDPHQQRETPTQNVLRHIYDPLLARNAKHPTTFDPVLALKWKRIGAKVVRFNLRKGVKFSNGAPFDAATVKYNVDRLLGLLPGTKPTLQALAFPTFDTPKVVNRYTVDIVTKVPDPLVLARLTQLMMIPNHAVDANPTALAANPIGTGPYTLVRWDRNNEVTLQAKAKYFLGKPKIARVIFRTLPDASSRLASLKTGDVDVITNLPPDNIGDAQSTGRARAKSVPSARIAAVWLDTLNNPILKNRRVRIALNYAVDTNTIIKRVMSNYALRVPTIVAPYFEGYNKKVKPYPYNPKLAKQLLQQAGYGNGFSMTLMVPHGRYLLGEETVQAVAGYLGNVGVKVNINQVEFGVFATATRTRKIPDGFFAAWGNALFNPIDMLTATVTTGTNGFSWYSNPLVDRLTNEASATLNDKKRIALLHKVQGALRGDPPFIFLYAYKDLYGVSKRLNWSPRSDETIYMYEASFAKGR